MANNQIEYLAFSKQNAPDVLEVANRLAELEQRKPHDSIRLLILEAGRNRIAQLQGELQEKNIT